MCAFELLVVCSFFFFKQKTAYEMRISDWSSDVCSSDLVVAGDAACAVDPVGGPPPVVRPGVGASPRGGEAARQAAAIAVPPVGDTQARVIVAGRVKAIDGKARRTPGRCNRRPRSEEHTSELPSLMRNTYAVFCLKKKTHKMT